MEYTYSNRSNLQKYIENRLIDYGYTERMTPDKYNAYAAVRRVVSIRLGLSSGRENLSEDQLVLGKYFVDIIIPSKGGQHEDS